MAPQKCLGPVTAGTVNEARKTVGDCEHDGLSFRPKPLTSQTNGDPADAIARAVFARTKPNMANGWGFARTKSISTAIIAKLIGADMIVALGVETVSKTPVLTLCAELVGAGLDPGTPLAVDRGEKLVFTVKSIGEAAGLVINGKGVGFAVRTAAPVRKNGSAGTGGGGRA